jgi:pyridoxamine 5'-phosphate oxidase
MNQKKYKTNKLGLNTCFLDKKNPFELFKAWMTKAKKTEINDPNALALATVNRNKQPSVRMVLLKGLTNTEFVFYTNLKSKKSSELKSNPKASMCFHWKSIRRQIRIDGSIKQVPSKVADQYFNTRPYGSRIGAWASIQSTPMESKVDLIKRIQEYKKKFPIHKKVPRPSHWSGWALKANEFEFWLDGNNRIHERLRYRKSGSKWVKDILYP